MPRRPRKAPSLRRIYERLLHAFGPQHWWPATSPFEVMVGAILTQAANWHNVEQAIAKLKAAQALSAKRLATLPAAVIQRLIRSTGYFRQKTLRLQTFSRWYRATYQANPTRMFRTNPTTLRNRLLGLPGIGPETADSILLYAGDRPIFVVDAYTRRVFSRHHLIGRDESYEAIQALVMDRLPHHPQLFNEFHALVVAVGKRYCHRRDPDCPHCPLGEFPHQLERGAHG